MRKNVVERSAGVVLSLLLALSVLVSGPASAAAARPFVISQAEDAVTLDPHMQSRAETMNVLLNIFDPLLDFNDKFEPVPNLATSWKQIEPAVWRFTLRKGVTFHNGEAFTARSVKFSVERILDPKQKAPMGSRLSGLKEARIVDDYTVDLVGREPYAPLLYLISLYLLIVPPDTVKQMGDVKFGMSGIGTGPYKVVSWTKEQQVVLEANPKYWRGEPRIQRVVFRPIPEDSSRVAALQTGESDVITPVPPDRWKDLQQGKGTRISARVGAMVYMGLDTFNPPFNDLRVRQALNHAVDIDAIIKTILLGTADRLSGPLFKSAFGYDETVPYYRHDPALAKKLLAEAGYPNGFETVLSTLPAQTGASKLVEVAEAIAYQLGQVGVRTKIEQLEPATAFARYKNREFKMFFFTWPEGRDPDRHLYSLFHSRARGYYYKNAEADRLLDLARATFNLAERRKLYEQLHRLLAQDAPWVFMYTQKTGWGIRQGVRLEAPLEYIRVIDIELAK